MSKNDCLPWNGPCNDKGYGVARRNGKSVLAHRQAWEDANGPIPPGKNVLHRCDNPPCCYVDHLFLGTQLENVEDRQKKGRQAKGSRHGRAKLTEEDASAIKASLGTHVEVALRFNVDPTTVLRIRSGRIWSHVGCL